MIKINLVPIALRKKSASGVLSGARLDLPRELVLGVGGGVVVLLIIVHICLFVVLLFKGVVLGAHQAQWAKVSPDRQAIDVLGTEMKDLKKKMTAMTEAVSSKSTTWAQRLNIISDSTGSGLWLKKITFDKNVLVIEGSVVSKNQSEIVVVGAFVANLKKDEGLMNDVSSLEVNSIVRGKMGATDVANFTLTVKMK